LWNGSLFVAVGSHGRIFTSADGGVWVEQNSGIDGLLSGIAWNGSHLVAVGTAGFVTSPDGSTWTAHTWGALPPAEAVAWAGHYFSAVGDDGSQLYSADGLQWSLAPVLTRHSLSAIAAGSDPAAPFVAVGRFGDILYSTDQIFGTGFDLVRPALNVGPRCDAGACGRPRAVSAH